MDKIEKIKDDLFRNLLNDTKPAVTETMNHLVYLLSVAFNYGYEMGYERGALDLDTPEAKDIPQSDNVE